MCSPSPSAGPLRSAGPGGSPLRAGRSPLRSRAQGQEASPSACLPPRLTVPGRGRGASRQSAAGRRVASWCNGWPAWPASGAPPRARPPSAPPNSPPRGHGPLPATAQQLRTEIFSSGPLPPPFWAFPCTSLPASPTPTHRNMDTLPSGSRGPSLGARCGASSSHACPMALPRSRMHR